MTLKSGKNWLYIIPSFYSLCGWIFAIFLFNINILESDSISIKSIFCIIYIIMLFLVSIIINYKQSKKVIDQTRELVMSKNDITIFIISTIIGLYGLYTYILDFSSIIGGLGNFFDTLSNSALEIREIGIENTSIGFQLSYFSWISIFFGVCIICSKNLRFINLSIIGLIIIIEFLLNLTFIDRTRPTWLLIICIFGVAFFKGGSQLKIGKSVLFTVFTVISIFFVFSITTGKYNVQSGLIENFMLYSVGGIGYLDSIINLPMNDEFTMVRTFYPVAKILEIMGLINDVPSQVLEPRLIPFWMNVGTFVEPIYSDGGMVFFLIMTPLLIIFTDYLALFFYSKNTFANRLVWVNLIFSGMISFFVPKFNSVPLYLFVFVAIICNIGISYYHLAKRYNQA
jgi:oligosaccharide repeat unit polymerase